MCVCLSVTSTTDAAPYGSVQIYMLKHDDELARNASNASNARITREKPWETVVRATEHMVSYLPAARRT